MQVLILAAGRGTRLDPLTRERPKVCLKVGSKSLLERQLDTLHENGVLPRQITIVGGHRYDRLVGSLTRPVRTVYNPKYREWNNIYSITLREPDPGPLLLVNGDGLYHPEIFGLALRHAGQDLLLVDTSKELTREDMKVRSVEGRLVRIGKEIPPGEAEGTYIGMAVFRGSTFERIRETALELIAAGDANCWYERAIGRVARTCPIGFLDVGGLRWTEVDDERDLRIAEEAVAQMEESADRCG